MNNNLAAEGDTAVIAGKGVNVSAKKEFISLVAKLSKAVTERQKLRFDTIFLWTAVWI